MQDRFGSIARAYYKEAYGAILVYDVGRSSSFETVPRWKGEIDDKVGHSPLSRLWSWFIIVGRSRVLYVVRCMSVQFRVFTLRSVAWPGVELDV